MYYCREIPSPFQDRPKQVISETIEVREKSFSSDPQKQACLSPLALLLLLDAFSPQKKDG